MVQFRKAASSSEKDARKARKPLWRSGFGSASFLSTKGTFLQRKALKTIVFGAFSYFLTYFEKAVFAENRLDNKLDNKLPEKLYFVEPNTLSSWVRSINFSRPVSSTPKKISTIFAIISSVAHFFCTDQIIGKTQMIPDVRR